MTTMLEQGIGAPDVTSLVRRAADGDRHAWEGLVDQYARLIWSITVDFKLTDSDASDVAQTTWLRLLQHIDRIEHPDRVGSWLAATARNECLRSLAARKRVVPVQDEAELTSAVVHEPDVGEKTLVDTRFMRHRAGEFDVIVDGHHPLVGRQTTQALVPRGRRQPGADAIRVLDAVNVLEQAEPGRLGDVSGVALYQLEFVCNRPDEPGVLID